LDVLARDVTRIGAPPPKYVEPDDVIQPTLGAMVTQHTQGTANRTDPATSTVRGSRFRRAATAGVLGASAVLAMSVLSSCSDGDGTGNNAGTDSANAANTAADTADGAGATVQDTAPAGESATPTTGGDGSRCTTDGLDITLGQSQGAAGSLLVDVDFTNSSSENCTLAGFPGVALVDDTGAPVGAPAVREDNVPGGTVDLAPGDSATAAVKISRAENYDDQACGPTPTSGLQVIVPEETATTVLDFADGASTLGDVTGCTSDAVELLTVQPLTAGA
jgi:hypothetical protein